ncbi:hypothetical protein [Shewanella sp.]|uniref:hypothetical protein n=1 Tax=Shewanella sp. TaxID=50422 RepID=UPI003A987ED9
MKLSTLEVAEHMVTTGKAYTAATLAKELGITAVEASAKLFNIRTTPKYYTHVTELPKRTVRVKAIKGQSSNQAMWNLAIFGRQLGGYSA